MEAAQWEACPYEFKSRLAILRLGPEEMEGYDFCSQDYEFKKEWLKMLMNTDAEFGVLYEMLRRAK